MLFRSNDAHDTHEQSALKNTAIEWLAQSRGIRSDELLPHVYVLPQSQAVRHAFRVACGLDSMVVGETQILGGARRLEERIRKGREATEARIRAAKDDELRRIIAELKAEGIIPEATPEPVKRSAKPAESASRDAQIQALIIQIQVAIGTLERARLAAQEDDAIALLMLI